jgi:hypothetical protein
MLPSTLLGKKKKHDWAYLPGYQERKVLSDLLFQVLYYLA